LYQAYESYELISIALLCAFNASLHLVKAATFLLQAFTSALHDKDISAARCGNGHT